MHTPTFKQVASFGKSLECPPGLAAKPNFVSPHSLCRPCISLDDPTSPHCNSSCGSSVSPRKPLGHSTPYSFLFIVSLASTSHLPVRTNPPLHSFLFNFNPIKVFENWFVLGYCPPMQQKYLIVGVKQPSKFDETSPPSLRGLGYLKIWITETLGIQLKSAITKK